MTISITFKLKEHYCDHGWIVTAFISKYLKAYFGKDNIEIVGSLTSWKKVGVRFSDNIVSNIQDLVEITHDKFSDAVDIIGTDFYNAIDDLVNEHNTEREFSNIYPDDVEGIKAWAKSEKFESIRFGIDVMFD